MLLVVPVSSHDAGLIDSFCDSICFFEPYTNHSLLVISRPNDAKHAKLVYSRISKSFLNSSIHIFNKNGNIGWPCGPNFYWKNCIDYLLKVKNSIPWYWMEMDSCPIKEGWLDNLEREYFQCKKPFLGMIDNINRYDSNGDVPFLVGSGVYPGDISIFYDSWREVEYFDIAFDVLCSSEVIKNCAESKIMKNCFRAKDFRCTNNGIQSINKRRVYNSLFDLEISDEIAIVHGCIDGSLSRLICGGSNMQKKY